MHSLLNSFFKKSSQSLIQFHELNMLYIKFLNQLYIYLHVICFLVRDSVNPMWLVLNKCILGSGNHLVSMWFAGHHDHLLMPNSIFLCSCFPNFEDKQNICIPPIWHISFCLGFIKGTVIKFQPDHQQVPTIPFQQFIWL